MKLVETALWSSGVLLIALYFAGQGWAESSRQQDIAQFRVQKQQSPAAAAPSTPPGIDVAGAADPSSGLDRAPHGPLDVTARQTKAHLADAGAIALLRIPRIALEVPIGLDTSERVLLRGAGWVVGTAAPGSFGNIAIAAHRDTFFRGLKDVLVGDLIELETLERTDTYRVSALSVVKPTDVYVLADTGEAALTLITCYPFYFVGNAPQRFIVHAVATEPASLITSRKSL